MFCGLSQSNCWLFYSITLLSAPGSPQALTFLFPSTHLTFGDAMWAHKSGRIPQQQVSRLRGFFDVLVNGKGSAEALRCARSCVIEMAGISSQLLHWPRLVWNPSLVVLVRWHGVLLQWLGSCLESSCLLSWKHWKHGWLVACLSAVTCYVVLLCEKHM